MAFGSTVRRVMLVLRSSFLIHQPEGGFASPSRFSIADLSEDGSVLMVCGSIRPTTCWLVDGGKRVAMAPDYFELPEHWKLDERGLLASVDGNVDNGDQKRRWFYSTDRMSQAPGIRELNRQGILRVPSDVDEYAAGGTEWLARWNEERDLLEVRARAHGEWQTIGECSGGLAELRLSYSGRFVFAGFNETWQPGSHLSCAFDALHSEYLSEERLFGSPCLAAPWSSFPPMVFAKDDLLVFVNWRGSIAWHSLPLISEVGGIDPQHLSIHRLLLSPDDQIIFASGNGGIRVFEKSTGSCIDSALEGQQVDAIAVTETHLAALVHGAQLHTCTAYVYRYR